MTSSIFTSRLPFRKNYLKIARKITRNIGRLLLQGLSEIENLEEYTDLKCLWLENNSIKTIKGLDHLSLLKCLFLHHNRIEEITVRSSSNFESYLIDYCNAGSVQVDCACQPELVQQLHQPPHQPGSPPQPSHLQCVKVVNNNPN